MRITFRSMKLSKCMAIYIISGLILSFTYVATSQYIRHRIINQRMFQMAGLNLMYYGRPDVYAEFENLHYLDNCKKYPIIPLIIFEGEYAPGYPSTNSWRSNCDIVNDQGTQHKNSPTPSRVPWNERSMNCPEPFLPFCWKKNRSSKNLVTNIMTIKGTGTITDLLLNGRYNENDQRQDELICFIEVDNTCIHWAQKGDLDINNLPQNLSTGVDGIGVTVRFRDGEIWYLRKNVPISILKQFMTIDGVMQHRRDELIKYRIARYEYGHHN